LRASVFSFGYKCWCAVASYFDGDGYVDLALSKLTLRFRIYWTDNYRLYLEQIKRFLERRGIATMRIVYARGAYHLGVGRIESVVLVARKMIQSGCVFKKRRELLALLGYYEDQLTGNQVVKEFNECVLSGVRSGFLRSSNHPLTYRGARRQQGRIGGHAAGRVLQKVDSQLKSRLVDERVRLGYTIEKLASTHHLSKTTVSRVLREPSGSSRLGRVGDQETLD
jgi:hypothetical protein